MIYGDCDFVAGQAEAMTVGLRRTTEGGRLATPRMPRDVIGNPLREASWTVGFGVGFVLAQRRRGTFATFVDPGSPNQLAETRLVTSSDHQAILRSLKSRGVVGDVDLQSGDGPLRRYQL